MEVGERQNKSRVVKIDSVDSWNSHFGQASTDGCPLFVHFTAAWCMPSVAMNPLVEELAAIYQDILFLTVDVDEIKEGNTTMKVLILITSRFKVETSNYENMGVAAKMSVKAMPTFMIMRYGAPVEKLVGANPEQIRKMLNGYVQSVAA